MSSDDHSRAIGKMAHPGFKAEQQAISKREGVSKESAGAILAAGARKASAGAPRAGTSQNQSMEPWITQYANTDTQAAANVAVIGAPTYLLLFREEAPS